MTGFFQQEGKTLHIEQCSCLKYSNYSVIGEQNDAWSQLSSLDVFQPKNERPTVDLVDVDSPCGQPIQSRNVTFHDADDLDKYLASNPIKGRTRFM